VLLPWWAVSWGGGSDFFKRMAGRNRGDQKSQQEARTPVGSKITKKETYAWSIYQRREAKTAKKAVPAFTDLDRR